ncbi:MAG TPA: NAD(P)-binding protein [Mycobacterium sp.]|nr:NAD(P)-binding protein [Mycobacterium sp.]
MKTIETDYLVVGAGATGMAFTDTLVSETESTVVVVDRGHQPGGHWLTAYPFVRLHQPSAFYGVNSRKLGSDTIDVVGWNEGFYELASGHEVLAYFEKVMHEQFLPTGRVSYFPMSEYHGDGRFSTLVGEQYTVTARKRIVDTTFLRTVVPSMRPPNYAVAPEVDCVPPNDLPACAVGRDRYVIVGGGKTGMDTCSWLLRHGVSPDKLTWIMPRDAWLLDRTTVQPGPLFAQSGAAAISTRITIASEATSIEDLFERLDVAGSLLRLDPAIRPRMYRCAIVSPAELDQLRRINDVVRMGHVRRIDADKIVLDDGEVPTSPSTLHIDCTADGLERRSATSVFDAGKITLQSVRGCQPVFSAAFIAHVETTGRDEDAKNELCTPIPHPDADLDWLRVTIADNRNQLRWLEDPELASWLNASRLDLISELGLRLPDDPRLRERMLGVIRTQLAAATENLEKLLAGADA